MAAVELQDSRILLIEDNIALAENVAEILEAEGCQVILTANGARARVAARQGFDVALVDVNLPDSTGLDLLRELRGADELCEILLVTGNASIEDAIDAVQGGAYDYIVKPFQVDELLSSVERACRQVRASRSARLLAEQVTLSEQSLRTLVDTVQALLLVLDARGRVLQANHAVQRLVGVSEDELRGMDWQERFVPEPERRDTRAVFDRIMAGEPRVAHENAIVDRNGDNPRVVQWRSSALEQPDGSLHIYASGIDVTEIKELQRRTHLAEKLAAVGTLSAGLAHEIRNPLNSAQLQLQLLERRLRKQSSEPRLLGPISLVQGEIQRLSDLVQDFLDFARPSRLRRVEIDLVELVAQVLELLTPSAQTEGISVKMRVVERVPVVVDGDKIRQVVLNLMRNAIEAVEPGGLVEVDVERRAHGAAVRVRDNGPGLSDEVRRHIFEPFFSTKATGTGLGMAICHSLVSQHGGDIQVSSSERGTTVEVMLPGVEKDS